MKHLAWADIEAVLDESLVGGRPLPAKDLGATISLITEEWVPDVPHVGANLVGATCLEHTLDEGCVSEALHHTIVCHSRFSYLGIGWENHHAQTIAWIAGDVALDATFVFGEVAPDERQIGAVGGLVKELKTEF